MWQYTHVALNTTLLATPVAATLNENLLQRVRLHLSLLLSV